MKQFRRRGSGALLILDRIVKLGIHRAPLSLSSYLCISSTSSSSKFCSKEFVRLSMQLFSFDSLSLSVLFPASSFLPPPKSHLIPPPPSLPAWPAPCLPPCPVRPHPPPPHVRPCTAEQGSCTPGRGTRRSPGNLLRIRVPDEEGLLSGRRERGRAGCLHRLCLLFSWLLQSYHDE